MVNKALMEQLKDRVKEQGIATGGLENGGKMCVVGHMCDMLGLLDNDIPLYGGEVMKVRNYGGYVNSQGGGDHESWENIIEQIAQAFDVDRPFLRRAQSINDTYGPQEVDRLLEWLDTDSHYPGVPVAVADPEDDLTEEQVLTEIFGYGSDEDDQEEVDEEFPDDDDEDEPVFEQHFCHGCGRPATYCICDDYEPDSNR